MGHAPTAVAGSVLGSPGSLHDGFRSPPVSSGRVFRAALPRSPERPHLGDERLAPPGLQPRVWEHPGVSRERKSILRDARRDRGREGRRLRASLRPRPHPSMPEYRGSAEPGRGGARGRLPVPELGAAPAGASAFRGRSSRSGRRRPVDESPTAPGRWCMAFVERLVENGTGMVPSKSCNRAATAAREYPCRPNPGGEEVPAA